MPARCLCNCCQKQDPQLLPNASNLVLTRKENEGISIGDCIHIQIISISDNGKRVVISIQADKDLPIHRDEIICETVARK